MSQPQKDSPRDSNAKAQERDIETSAVPSAHLVHDIFHSFGWKDMNVTVKYRATKQPQPFLTDANGLVMAGEMIAGMVPSDSGKTTLLNVVIGRVPVSACQAGL